MTRYDHNDARSSLLLDVGYCSLAIICFSAKGTWTMQLLKIGVFHWHSLFMWNIKKTYSSNKMGPPSTSCSSISVYTSYANYSTPTNNMPNLTCSIVHPCISSIYHGWYSMRKSYWLDRHWQNFLPFIWTWTSFHLPLTKHCADSLSFDSDKTIWEVSSCSWMDSCKGKSIYVVLYTQTNGISCTWKQFQLVLKQVLE